jgi:predicted transcriptional regulator
MVSRGVLSTDLKICVAIYDHNQRKDPIWFSKLVDEFKGESSRATISKSIDKLFDLGMIDGKWEKVESRWTRTFVIAGEAEDLVKKLYESTKDSEA